MGKCAYGMLELLSWGSLPLQMAVALGLLYMQVKFAFLAGLAVIILLIPVNRVIALKISASSDLMMKEKDERVRKMGELLVYMRTIKMYAWEHFFVGRILQSRNQELKQLSVCKPCCHLTNLSFLQVKAITDLLHNVQLFLSVRKKASGFVLQATEK
jgi:hypothetical protein